MSASATPTRLQLHAVLCLHTIDARQYSKAKIVASAGISPSNWPCMSQSCRFPIQRTIAPVHFAGHPVPRGRLPLCVAHRQRRLFRRDHLLHVWRRNHSGRRTALRAQKILRVRATGRNRLDCSSSSAAFWASLSSSPARAAPNGRCFTRHIGACVAGGALLAVRWAGSADSSRAAAAQARTSSAARCSCVAAAALAAGAWWLRTVPWRARHRIENPAIAPASMDTEGDGPSGPFFPSSAQTTAQRTHPRELFYGVAKPASAATPTSTNNGKAPRTIFPRSTTRGIARASSTCRTSVGVKPSKWCAGCHDPALLYQRHVRSPDPRNRKYARRRKPDWAA